MIAVCTKHAIFNSICDECVAANFNKHLKTTKYERDSYKEANRLNAQTVDFLANSQRQERATLLVFANQYLALQRWIHSTVPEWTTEVQYLSINCESIPTTQGL